MKSICRFFENGGKEHIMEENKKTSRISPRTLSGFMELLPRPQQQMERIMEVLRSTYARYGFTPLDTPVIESKIGRASCRERV